MIDREPPRKPVIAPREHAVVSLAEVYARRVAPLRLPVTDFARAVWRRHERGDTGARALDRVFARTQITWQHTDARRWDVTIAPRLEMQLTSLHRSVEQVHLRAREAADEGRQAPPAIVGTLVERLIEREKRIHALTREEVRTVVERETSRVDHDAATPDDRARTTFAPTPNGVERVFRRGASAPSNEASRPRSFADGGDTPSTRVKDSPAREAATTARPTPPSDFDVHQLADRVVRVIDKRLTAQRERFGKI